MSETAGTAVRVGYVDPAPPATGGALASATAEFRVDRVANRDALDPAGTDCLVVAHGPAHADCFAVLRAVRDAAVAPPVVVLTDEDVAERALAAGAADVVRGDPADPPTALLVHRVRRAVEAATTEATAPEAFVTLGRAIRELLRASDRDAVSDAVVRGARDALGLPAVCVLLADGECDALEPAAVSDRTAEALSTVPDVWPAEGLAAEAFERGEIVRFDDETEARGPLAASPGCGVCLPLGEHGVLVAGDPDSTAFEPALTRLADTLAAAAEAAIARIEREVALEREQAFTERVLDALSDVVYVLDPDGTFRRWNERLTDVAVADPADLPETTLPELVVPGDRDGIAAALARAREEGVSETHEAALVTAVGDRVTYEFKLTPLTDARGAVTGLTGTAREVTDRNLREQRLGVLTRVLRHNVRNQMTVVQGRADRLADRLGEDEDVAAVRESATHLVDLSDKARRVGAALRESSANRRPLDVASLVRTTLAALHREFPDVTLAFDAPESLSARATEGVTFAVEELVRNGIVHNDGGAPTVSVTVERDPADDSRHPDDAPGTVAITVADDGPGIPEAEEVALTGGHETDLDHATGLGLWLVNWVTTAAGGSVTCEESPALGGAAVTLRFPAVASE